MKRLWIFGMLMAFSAAALAASEIEFLYQSGNQSWLNGGRAFDPDALRAKYGDRFAAMARDGRTWVITGRGALDDVQRLYEPMADVARQQAKLGSKQAALGSEQARIGQEQAIVGAEQAALSTAAPDGNSRELSERQRALGEKQRELSERQRDLGDQQKLLGKRQRELWHEAMPKIEHLFDDAIRKGTAIAD